MMAKEKDKKPALKMASFNVRVSEDDREMLRKVGQELDIPPAVLVRYAVKKYVTHLKKLDKDDILNIGFS